MTTISCPSIIKPSFKNEIIEENGNRYEVIKHGKGWRILAKFKAAGVAVSVVGLIFFRKHIKKFWRQGSTGKEYKLLPKLNHTQQRTADTGQSQLGQASANFETTPTPSLPASKNRATRNANSANIFRNHAAPRTANANLQAADTVQPPNPTPTPRQTQPRRREPIGGVIATAGRSNAYRAYLENSPSCNTRTLATLFLEMNLDGIKDLMRQKSQQDTIHLGNPDCRQVALDGFRYSNKAMSRELYDFLEAQEGFDASFLKDLFQVLVESNNNSKPVDTYIIELALKNYQNGELDLGTDLSVNDPVLIGVLAILLKDNYNEDRVINQTVFFIEHPTFDIPSFGLLLDIFREKAQNRPKNASPFLPIEDALLKRFDETWGNKHWNELSKLEKEHLNQLNPLLVTYVKRKGYNFPAAN